MQSTTGFFLLLLLGYSKSLSNTRCFQEHGRSLCFTKADPLLALSWSSAMEWCKNIGGTLPTMDYSQPLYGNVIGYFGLHTETLWLGANFTYDPDNWYWTNGSSFTGTLENRNISGKTHAYITRNGTEVKFVAAAKTDSNSFICQYNSYSDLSCASSYQDSYWTSEKCYVKNRYRTSWNLSRSLCGQSDLAIIDNLNGFSRWLEDMTNFWIGLRCSWWTWHDAVTGNSYEVMDSGFGYVNDLFNATAQCLASYRDYGNVYWTNLDCSSNLPFICQYDVDQNPTASAAKVDTTHTKPTTTVAAGTTHSNPTTTVADGATRINPTNSPTNSPTTASEGEIVSSGTQTATTTTLRNSNSDLKPAVFGMSMEFYVGLGGGLFLATTVWLGLLTACAYKSLVTRKYTPNKSAKAIGNTKTTSRDSYDDYTVNNTPEMAHRVSCDELTLRSTNSLLTDE